jgi:hypothetical protein
MLKKAIILFASLFPKPYNDVVRPILTMLLTEFLELINSLTPSGVCEKYLTCDKQSKYNKKHQTKAALIKVNLMNDFIRIFHNGAL